MGIKSGRFTGRNGHDYEVQIFGTTVTNDTVELSASPAYIGMAAGERKFVGYKSTTARVQILTDVPLVDLYSQGATSISMQIWDMTDNRCEFDGYVVPFALDQPYTGKLDVVTVNAVDKLTARKDVKYANVDEVQGDYGTDRNAFDIVQAIASRAGIERMVVHTNFDTLSDSGVSPLSIPVAQAGFLQDEKTELEVLSAICMFFGYTASYVGDTLYLWDEHCLTHAGQGQEFNCNVYTRDEEEARWLRSEHYYDDQGTPLWEQSLSTSEMRNDLSVTIERAYDGIQITPSGSDTSVLLPDVCADENLEENDDILGTSVRTYQDYDEEEGIDYIQWREPRRSLLLRTGESSPSGPVEFGTSGDKMKPSDSEDNYWTDGAIPIRIINAPRSRATVLGESIITPDVGAPINMIWVRGYSESGYIARQRDDKCYSHTGGLIAVNFSFRILYRTDWQNIDATIDLNMMSYIGMLQLNVGGQYFRDDIKAGSVAAWSDSPEGHWLVKGGKLLPTMYGVATYSGQALVLVPNSGQVGIELRWASAGAFIIASPEMYIESLSVTAVGDAIDLTDADMRHEYVENPLEVLEVSSNLTTRMSGLLTSSIPRYGVNARPSVVPAEYWNGGYMGRRDQEAIPISGILMEQLRERYGQARPAYRMTAEKVIRPYAPVWWNGKLYTVEAYEIDLYNTTTNITID